MRTVLALWLVLLVIRVGKMGGRAGLGRIGQGWEEDHPAVTTSENTGGKLGRLELAVMTLMVPNSQLPWPLLCHHSLPVP